MNFATAPFNAHEALAEIRLNSMGYRLPERGALNVEWKNVDGRRLVPVVHDRRTVRVLAPFVAGVGHVARVGELLELDEPLAADLVARGLAEAI